jgi:hypothetical protein
VAPETIIYEHAPHGLPETHKDRLNVDLLDYCCSVTNRTPEDRVAELLLEDLPPTDA